MKLKLQFILAAFIALAIYVPVAQAQIDTPQTITQAGTYRITVSGADGGIFDGGGSIGAGSGATVEATFSLQAGDVLTLVTGIAGTDEIGGGGGGSAVILTRSSIKTLLLVAGAGGGASTYENGGGGNSAQGSAVGGGVTAANGGGGGFGVNAAGASTSNASGGSAGTLTGGAAGGRGQDGFGNGGYGFGSGGGGSYEGGGGGGYGGGNGYGGVGGTSYVDASGINVTRTDGITSGGGGSSRNGSVSITLLAPTAGTASISGRVTSMTGRRINGVRLSLTDSSGEVRTVTAAASGYYRFNDVPVGQTYVLSANEKHYTFSQPVHFLNVNGETEVNFIANSEKR